MLKLIIDIFSVPAILIGLISMMGLILQKKSSTDILVGTIKTIMGVLILSAGADIVVKVLDDFSNMFQHGFGIKGIIANNDAITIVALKKYGGQASLVMLFGMIFNMLIAKLTRFKYIFLTGNFILNMAVMLTFMLYQGGLRGISLLILGGLILGFLMTIFPALVDPTVKKITGSNEFSLGHFGSIGFLVAAGVGKLVGKNSKSTEEIEVPERVAFLKNSSITITLTMAILFSIVAMFCGNEFVETNLSGGQNYILFSFIQSITFAVGIYIIVAGVELIIGEIVPAFKGIAEKVVPNAKPAIDCPVLFKYAPNAVLIGFLSSLAGGIVAMIILMGISKENLIIPGIVNHFFSGGISGIFGNATGGRKGAILGAFAQGMLIVFLQSLIMPNLGEFSTLNTTFAESDFGAVAILLKKILKLIAI